MHFGSFTKCDFWILLFGSQSQLGKKRSELKHLIKEREKKLEEIKQSINVLKVSPFILSDGSFLGKVEQSLIIFSLISSIRNDMFLNVYCIFLGGLNFCHLDFC